MPQKCFDSCLSRPLAAYTGTCREASKKLIIQGACRLDGHFYLVPHQAMQTGRGTLSRCQSLKSESNAAPSQVQHRANAE